MGKGTEKVPSAGALFYPFSALIQGNRVTEGGWTVLDLP